MIRNILSGAMRFPGNPLSFKHLQFYQHTVLICIIFKTAVQVVTKEISTY